MKYTIKRKSKKIVIALTVLSVLLLCLSFLQTYWAHRRERFQPAYIKQTLTEETDYKTFFLQTGLGKPAVDALVEADGFETIFEIQDRFFKEPQVTCKPTFGWFTKSDRIEKNNAPSFVDLQPGDIILTLSTHSCGWRHGHAGLVIDEDSVLECMTLGKMSAIAGIGHWSKYSTFAVLRVKGVSEELQKQVVSYAQEHLCKVAYHLSAGFLGEKAPAPDVPQFGLQCAYLVWYAWQVFGYDLDSDGGRLVTPSDLLRSDLLEVVQIYGINPEEFCGEQVEK